MNSNGTRAQNPANCKGAQNSSLAKACNSHLESCCFFVITDTANQNFIGESCSTSQDGGGNCVGVDSAGSKALKCYSEGASAGDVCQSQYNLLDPMSRRCCAFVDKEKFTLAAGCVQLIVAFMLLFSYALVSSGEAGEYRKAAHTQPLIDAADAHTHGEHGHGDGGDALGFGRSSPEVGGSDDDS